MINFDQYKYALIFISTYIVLAHLALKRIHDHSKEDVHSHFGDTTILVVAHPDDETMFFGPTLMNLLKYNKSLVILCMSNGDADDYGEEREQEFANVVKAFGSAVTLNVIKDNQLPDSMFVEWSTAQIGKHVEKQIRDHNSPIQTLLTFDSYGVSGHTNHRSIYKAIRKLKRDKLKDLQLDYLVLKSISLWRKYTFFLDSVITVVSNNLIDTKIHKTFTLGIGLTEYLSLKQILGLHRSQMAWFRQIYMMFSRYMFINDLEHLA